MARARPGNGDDAAVPVTRQANPEAPGGDAEAPLQPGRPTRKLILPTLMSMGILGIGLAVLIRTLQRGELMGTAFAMVWCVLAATMMGRMLLAIVGIGRRKPKGGERHRWTDASD